MNITPLHNQFKQSVEEELRKLEPAQLSNEAELILEDIISTATQTLIRDREENQQSDDVFNQKVNNAIEQVKLFIQEAYREQSEIEQNVNYIKPPKKLVKMISIGKEAFEKAKKILCPIYPFC